MSLNTGCKTTAKGSLTSPASNVALEAAARPTPPPFAALPAHSTIETRIYGTLILVPGGAWRFEPFHQERDGAWLCTKQAAEVLGYSSLGSLCKVKHLLIYRRAHRNKGMEFRLDSLLAFKAIR